MMNEEALNHIINKMVDNKKIFSAVLRVESGDSRFSWTGAAGSIFDPAPPGMFYFGVGLEKLWTPRIISPFKPIREVLGFWGQTGSFAFYNPDADLYFCGTTNQINGAGHRAAANAMVKIIKSAL